MDSIIDDLKNVEEGDKIFIENTSAYINLEFLVKVNNKSGKLLWGVMKDLDSDDLQGIGRASRYYDAFQEYIDEGAEISILKKDGTTIVGGKAANPISTTNKYKILEEIKKVEKGDTIKILNFSSNSDSLLLFVESNDGTFIGGDITNLDNDDEDDRRSVSMTINDFKPYLDDGAEIKIFKNDNTVIVNNQSSEILAIDLEEKRPIIITNINESRTLTSTNEINYVYDYKTLVSNGVRPITREEFFVTHDIITASYENKNQDEKANDTLQVVNIYRPFQNDNVWLVLKIMDSDVLDRIGRELQLSYESFFAFFYNINQKNYYNLHELLETPKLVPSVTQSDDLILQGYKDKIHEINKNIADALFLKSITSPIDFESKIELGQNISKMQKEVNILNFKIVERRLTDLKLFDDLFEQSFTTIQNNYEDVYTTGESEYFAPDGARSELSNRLNELIRTPQFKEWFGDWELSYIYKDVDPNAIPCSKVLDNNYEPLLVWHGTGAEFSYFRFDNVPAAYFARKEAYSQWFANLQGGDKGYTIPFFLNMRNPLDLTRFGIKEVSSKDFFDYIFLETGMSMEYLEVNPMFFDSSIPPLPTWVFLRRNPAMLKKLAESSFDGIHFYEHNPNVEKGAEAYETEAFITFEPTQCKIADPKKGELLLSSLKSFLLKRGGKI
jgi:hypothetical protein